jgi:phosphonate transport system substrate-binding protein
MQSLKLTSLMAENTDLVVLAIAHYIYERTDISTSFIDDIPWQERGRVLDAGKIDLAWICGLPYVLKADQPAADIELIAAPVMQGNRYQDRPIYFSDVVVHRDSQFQTFADLRGASWAYNESGSHSGYNLVRYHLATLGEQSAYFGKVIESGAHLSSLRMILERQVDASAIDSIVLELELQRRPALGTAIRIIESLGPSPIPPLIISRSLPQETRDTLRELLLHMHEDPHGRTILTNIQIARFAWVEDRDYDAIRDMTRKAKLVTL